MNDKIKEVFLQIRAEEALKDKTKEFLAYKTKRYTKPVRHRFHIYAVVCVSLLFLLAGGHWLYFTPTSIISIDINPSLELSVNRFDLVISVDSLNADAKELADVIDVRFRNYVDAVNQILANKKVDDLLSNNEVMTITITGSDETQSAMIFSELEGCTTGHKNTYCYFSSSAEAASAHEAGLSCGKYRAFLELQLLDPDVTAESVQGMTMREILDLIDRLSGGNPDETSETPPGRGKKCGRHNSCGGHP